jgi:hypothetical protein
MGSFCLFLAVLVPLQAGILTIGIADDGNSFPFGLAGGGYAGTIYQQVYAPSDFAGPIDIQSVHFYRTQFGSPTDTITAATYTIKLSTSRNPVDGLDTTVFANNVGADVRTFGVYNVGAGTQVGNDLSFNMNVSDFNYNPANGPLLLEIDLSGIGSRGNVFMDEMNGDANGLFSRAHDFGTAFSGYGLVTGFDFGSAAVPEPGTTGLLAIGLIALIQRKLRRS